MQNCLKAWRPLIMFEYLQRTNLDETQTLFQAAEYIIAEIVDGYLRIAEQPVRPLQNLIAIPTECRGNFDWGRNS